MAKIPEAGRRWSRGPIKRLYGDGPQQPDRIRPERTVKKGVDLDTAYPGKLGLFEVIHACLFVEPMLPKIWFPIQVHHGNDVNFVAFDRV